MNEVKAKQCKVCNEVKPAYFDGIRADGKTRILVNADGRQWNGRTCPECQIVITRENMRKLRARD